MLKNIFIFVSLFSTIILSAGGGGGSSFGGETTQDKYGKDQYGLSFVELPNTATSTCSENIKVVTKSSVRFKNWFFIVSDWKGGYATTSATQCEKAVNIYRMQIAQYADVPTSASFDYLIVGEINQYNTSFLKLELQNKDKFATAHTVHSIMQNNNSVHINIENDWGGLLKNISYNRDIFTW